MHNQRMKPSKKCLDGNQHVYTLSCLKDGIWLAFHKYINCKGSL